MANDIYKNNLAVILIQIDEAHSSDWPLAIDSILGVEQPEPHKTIDDRLVRAQEFVDTYNPPYPIYVDNWNNEFAELFKAWPDRYHCIDKDLKVIAKSQYYDDEEREATIVEDCTDILKKLMS